MPDDHAPTDKPTFDLEPLPDPEKKPEPPRPPAPAAPAQPSPAPPSSVRPPAPARRGLLGRLGGMLEGFDEDADFSRDPEVERAMKKGPAPAGPAGAQPVEAPPRPPLVQERLGPAKLWLVMGAVLLVGAVIAAAVNQKVHPVVASILTVYDAALHASTGIAALAIVALLLRRPLGPLEQAGARMFVAVSAFLLLVNMRIDLIGQTKWEELTLATLAYVGVVAGAFNLWRRKLMYVVCAHFFLWMAVQIGMELSGWLARAPATP